MTDVKLGRYKHYKNTFYQVIGIGLHTETREKMVIYHALYETPELTEEYGSKPFFVRPATMFHETITVDGIDVPRFQFVEAA